MFLSLFKPQKGAAWMAAGLMALTFVSCDSSFVYEDLRLCIPDYRVRLSYDHNLTSTQKVELVEAAEIYAFDQDGKLAAISKADKAELEANDWSLPIDLERFETYDLVVWCGLTANSPFGLDGTRAVTSKEDLTCRLATQPDERGRNTSDKKFPHLFHSTKTVSYTVDDGLEEYVVPLVKNNNEIDIIIRSERDEQTVASDYTVEIIDKNGVMAHDNAVSGDEVIYLPTGWTSGEFPFSDGQGGYSTETSQAVKAEMHVARLMKDASPVLKIYRNSDGKRMYDGSLLELFAEVKQHIRPDMDLQEYLDRQDQYNVDLVLTNKVSIYVNGWRIIENEMDWTIQN